MLLRSCPPQKLRLLVQLGILGKMPFGEQLMIEEITHVHS